MNEAAEAAIDKMNAAGLKLFGCQFSVHGAPVAWGRARLQTRDRKGRALKKPRHFTPPKTEAFEARIGWAAKESMRGRPPVVGPVRVEVMVYLPIPKSWPKYKRELAAQQQVYATSKPDWDNFGKAICDGMNAVVYVDDAQIIECRLRKEYATLPEVNVLVQPLAVDAELALARNKVPRGPRLEITANHS